MTAYRKGDRVVLPDPRKVNPFNPTPAPFGPGVVEAVTPKPFGELGSSVSVRLDSGELRVVGDVFVRREARP